MKKQSHAAGKSPLERLLGLFAEVHGGEGGTALLLTLSVFLLLTTYYIIKPVREALILSTEGGAVLKSVLGAVQGGMLLVLVPVYGLLAKKFPRRPLINVVTIFFVGCLVLFYFLAQIELPLGVAFFLWVGIFNLMVVAQFWSFANDVYTPEQGKRLFAIVGFGASLGAVLGSKIAGLLIAPLGVYQMLLVAAGVLLVSLAITNIVDTREKKAGRGDSGRAPAEETITDGGPLRAFQLVIGQRYLLLIALMIMVLNWVNTSGEYILGQTVATAANQAVADGTAGGLNVGEYIGKFYADFFTVVNILGVLIQLFLVSRILKYLGVRVALMILPVIAFGGYMILAFFPVLSIVRWAKTAENATDYSLQNTLRGVLFLPTTREQKYMAKQAIDTIFVRAGDTLSALLVWAGTTYFALTTQNFAMILIALAAIWLVLAFLTGREHARLSRETRS